MHLFRDFPISTSISLFALSRPHLTRPSYMPVPFNTCTKVKRVTHNQ
jgi:hypothetical protein